METLDDARPRDRHAHARGRRLHPYRRARALRVEANRRGRATVRVGLHFRVRGATKPATFNDGRQGQIHTRPEHGQELHR